MELKGKTAIVTGAGKGVGRAIATRLAAEGMNVGLISRTPSDLESLATELAAFDVKICSAATDIAYRDQVESAVEKIKAELGEIHFLINNASVGLFGLFLDMPPEDFERSIQVNLMGTYYMTRAVLPGMVESNYGTILNISSGAGEQGYPYCTAYSASKFGVMGLTEALMSEVRWYNIRVGAFTLDTINTDMSKQSGLQVSDWDAIMQPEDIAEFTVSYLKLPQKMFLKTAAVWNTDPKRG